jgi:hypothetical protein
VRVVHRVAVDTRRSDARIVRMMSPADICKKRRIHFAGA